MVIPDFIIKCLRGGHWASPVDVWIKKVKQSQAAL
jgi:hypothetical protein